MDRIVISDAPVGPVCRHFAWRPIRKKWLILVRRQRWERTLWLRYWDDPTHGNGGGEFIESTVTEKYWRYGPCGDVEMS